jgi:hypothetical protein
MRPRPLLCALACLVAAGAAAGPAHATDCSTLLSPCIDSDVLWPHGGPARFQSVGSTETVGAGQLGFALIATYLSRPIVLRDPAPGGSGSSQFAIDDQVSGTFLWSYGVVRRLQLDLAVPLTFGQSGSGLAPVTGGDGLKDTAVRDLRFGLAYSLRPGALTWAEGNGWGLAARLDVVAPTGDRDQFAGERAGVLVPGLSASARLGRWTAGAELGARVRPVTQLLDARIGTQLVGQLGVGVDVLSRDRLGVALEGWALPGLAQQAQVIRQSGALASQAGSGHIVPAEWQFSVRSVPVPDSDVSVQIGGGGAIPFGGDAAVTTPRFRVTLGVRWEPRTKEAAPTTTSTSTPTATATATATTTAPATATAPTTAPATPPPPGAP